MIDRSARNAIAEATRHYLAGLSTNFVFDDTIFDLKSSDSSIRAIRTQLWLIYDDLQEHRHEGKWVLSENQRDTVLRIILFLKSDIEYQWPTLPSWYTVTRPIIYLLTFSFGPKTLDQIFERKDNENVWPFHNLEEIRVAKNEPKYLASAT